MTSMNMGFRFGSGRRRGSATPAPAAVTISGPRLAVIGDSRSDNGMVNLAQHPTITDFGTGFSAGTRLQGVHTWMTAALGHKLQVVANWTLGGGKSSQFCNDVALDRIAARNPDAVIYLGTTNDPVDYTAGGGFDSIALGDPDADPSTLDRVGSAYPTAPASSTQGTTLGNLDKMLRYFAALGVPVICFEIPTESGSRTQRNADVHKWLQAQAAAETYDNLLAPNVYDDLLATPGADDGATATGIWRDDVEATTGLLYADPVTPLHPSPAGARFIGEAIAGKSLITAAVAGLSSQSLLPDGTNDASFLNDNPNVEEGAGSGTEFGSTGTVSGTICDDWQVDNNIPGTSAVACSSVAAGQGQRLTITRTGGSSATVGRNVRYRGSTEAITPVEGDVYVIDAEVVVPARAVQDVFGVEAYFGGFEAGLEDADGNNIQSLSFGSFKNAAPNPFPKDGDRIVSLSVPFEITAAMVASATGNIALTPQVEITIADNADTATNGAIVIDILRAGMRKVA